jgi:hypothetical protein
MHKEARSIAVSFAVFIFFVMSCAGWFMGVTPGTCAARAIGGAIITYIVVSIAARIVISIIIDSIVEKKFIEPMQEENK